MIELARTGMFTPCEASAKEQVDLRLIFGILTPSGGSSKKTHISKDRLKFCSDAEIYLPALSERRSDIPKLALATLARVNAFLREKKSLSRKSLEYLGSLRWPGNISALNRVVERGAILAPKAIIEPADLKARGRAGKVPRLLDDFVPPLGSGFSLESYLAKIREKILLTALDATDGNQSEAARMLKLTPQAVNQFLRVLERRRKDGGSTKP